MTVEHRKPVRTDALVLRPRHSSQHQNLRHKPARAMGVLPGVDPLREDPAARLFNADNIREIDDQ